MAINIISGHTLEDIKNAVIGEIKPYAQDFLHKNIIVVPDRYSLIVEKSVFKVLNISATFNISVMGINALAKKLIQDAKLDCVFVDQTESDFVIFHAIQNTKDNFICFSKIITPGLVDKIKNAMALLRSSDITSENIDIDAISDNRLKDKLHDLKLVMAEYERLLDFRLDATKVIRTFSTLIESTSNFSNVNFYFCGFDSFTVQGYDIVKKICKTAKNVTIGVISPSKYSNKIIYDDEMEKNFISYFTQNNMDYNIKRIEPKFDGDQKSIYENVFGYNIKNQDIQSIVISLPQKKDELENVAMQIAYMTKNNFRYSDIAVATKEYYFPLIENVFSKYDISFYVDDKVSVSNTPLYQFLSSIFTLLTFGFEKENIINLIENYFFDIEKQNKYKIINFVRENNIQFKKIEKIYNFDEKIKFIFEKLNKINVFDTFNYYIDFIYDIFEYFNIKLNIENLSQKFKQNGDLSLEKVYVQMYEKVDNLNKKIVDILGEQKISVKDFQDFYLNALKNLNINKIPLGVDCVFVGDICKSFFEPKKYLFVMGAESSMPNRVKDESLILDQDIENLSHIVKISPTVKVINRRNKFRLFDALTTAQNVVITHPLFDDEGKKIVRATFVDDICSLGAKKFYQEDFAVKDDLSSLELHAPNKVVARQYVNSSKSGARIKQALLCLGEDVEYTQSVPEIFDAGLLLKGDKIRITQLENYFTCPFKHFVQYGLKLVENKDGKMKQNDFGNFLHDFCNNLAKSSKGNLGKLEEQQLNTLIDDTYENLLKNPKYFLLSDDENDMVKKILKSEVHRFGQFLNYEQKVSDFKIYKTEYKFDGDITLTVDEKDYSIVGIVDRVDKFDQYFRVIDYKTGSLASNNAQISNLYYGTKIQVYVYLKALTEKFKGKAFGAFYLPISNAFSGDDNEPYKLNGYFLDDVSLCEHADNELKSTYKSRLFEASFSTSKKNLESGVKSLLSRKKVGEKDFEAMLKYSVEIVRQGLKEILAGNIEPAPTLDACKFCGYKDICGHDANLYRKQLLKVSPTSFSEVKYE